MGQSASLYRIAKNDFSKVLANPDDFGLFKIAKSHETFEKSFEGLRFVLLKEKEENAKALVEQIFYPATFAGEQINYDLLDFNNLPDDFGLMKEPVCYQVPDVVSDLSLLLSGTSVEQFQARFNPDELNAEGIYPSGVWNRSTDPDHAFNVSNMTEEFLKLKPFYQLAKGEGDYILSYVG